MFIYLSSWLHSLTSVFSFVDAFLPLYQHILWNYYPISVFHNIIVKGLFLYDLSEHSPILQFYIEWQSVSSPYPLLVLAQCALNRHYPCKIWSSKTQLLAGPRSIGCDYGLQWISTGDPPFHFWWNIKRCLLDAWVIFRPHTQFQCRQYCRINQQKATERKKVASYMKAYNKCTLFSF